MEKHRSYEPSAPTSFGQTSAPIFRNSKNKNVQPAKQEKVKNEDYGDDDRWAADQTESNQPKPELLIKTITKSE